MQMQAYYLDVHFEHFEEEALDPVLVLDVVEDDESDLGAGDEGRYEPIIKLVHNLQVHVVRLPNVLVNEVEGGVGNELIQITVVLLLQIQKLTCHFQSNKT
jgi:hypothetical protein